MNDHITIFDSRKAMNTYKDTGSKVKSSNFYIPPGHGALVELTTHSKYFNKMTFSAIRTPRSIENQDCFNADNVGKVYHQVPCGNSFGSDSVSINSRSIHSPYRKSVLRWGYDQYNQETFQYHYITRPGDYYLVADKVEAFNDCNAPTLIEVFIFPMEHSVHLHQSCHVKESVADVEVVDDTPCVDCGDDPLPPPPLPPAPTPIPTSINVELDK